MSVGRILLTFLDKDRMDALVYTSGNCFKTKEEAQKYADKFSEILKDSKL